MAQLRAELKRSFLQSLYDSVVDGTASEDLVSDDVSRSVFTLEAALKAFQRMGFNSLKTGTLIVGSSGYAHETRLATPDIMRSFSQEEIFSLAQEYREVYTEARAALVAAGDASPTDAEIFAEMMANDRLQAASFTQTDHTGLRFG
jgi:hypothetical protein